MRISMASFNPFRRNASCYRHSTLPSHETSPYMKPIEREKNEQLDRDSSGEYDYSYPSSPVASSTRSSFDSYPSDLPMLRRKPPAISYRYAYYRLPRKIVNSLCFVLILTLVIFIGFLARMSYLSSHNLEQHIHKRPPPFRQWESFAFLTRYYGGIRTLVPFSENKPEYPRGENEESRSNMTSTKARYEQTIRHLPASKTFNAYPDYSSEAYMSEYFPVQECFIDTKSSVRMPHLQYYTGRPEGFPDHIMGSYELLGLPEDICFERYGRLGPYGHGYGVRLGGLGSGYYGDSEGSDAIWQETPHMDFRNVDWAAAQGRCFDANSARFNTYSPFSVSAPILAVDDSYEREENNLEAREVSTDLDLPSKESSGSPLAADNNRKKLHRTAIIVRTWDSYEYREEDILYLRALISEMSLGSGGEYDIHLLVHVKDETVPVWADDMAYEQHLRKSVPEEFWGIATLWSETQMQMLYQGLSKHDTFPRGPELRVHGVYRGLMQALQYFAHNHAEYDFFWHLEMDFRSTGHFYDIFSKFESWSKKQPRKGLWERNSRFYVPAVHGTWEDFKQMVRVQTESGTDSPNNIWSGLNVAKQAAKGPIADKSIWGPDRPEDSNDLFETSNDPIPPSAYAQDKYEWGVGEEADLITLNPIFDPDGTSWLLAKDVTGYNTSGSFPPRRAAIITTCRLSKRLLNTMHRETAFAAHHAFPEMWPATTALHHGYKAVYVPHPTYIDREWPLGYLAATMNGGRNGATGGARTSVFGEREHNFLGTTFYYNAGFAGNLWRRWLGLKVDNEGGEVFETQFREEGFEKLGKTGVPGMQGGEGRMCLPPMVLHPVKGVELPVESIHLEDLEVVETDPTA